MATFVDVDITVDQESLQDDAFTYVEDKVPGYSLDPADPMTWLIEAIGRLASETAFVASQVPSTVLRTLGERVYGISRGEGSPAIASTTWIARDTVGHIIPAGTAISIDGFGFLTDTDYTITAGSSSIAGVLVTSIDIGASLNGLGADAEPIDSLAWIDSITVVGTTSDGADAESDDDYQDRIVTLLQLQAPRLVTARDAEVLAKETENGPRTGVDRVAVLDNYDPYTNLLSANQASLETDTSGWAAGSSTSIARNTTQASDGIASLAITRNSTTGSALAVSTNVSVNGGQAYAAYAEFKAATTARSCQLGINWYDASSVFISTSSGGTTADTTSAFIGVSVLGTAPSNAAFASISLVVIAAVATEVHYVDKIQLKLGTSIAWTAGGVNPAAAERIWTVIPIDDDGLAVNGALAADIQSDLDARREVNSIVYVISPQYTAVTAVYNVTAQSGYDTATLVTTINAALTDYLSPANWGVVGEDRRWVNKPIIYYLQIAGVIEKVDGVDHINSLTVNGGTSNVTMAGIAPLPAATPTITGTVV